MQAAVGVRITQTIVDNMARIVEQRATPEAVLADMTAEVQKLLRALLLDEPGGDPRSARGLFPSAPSSSMYDRVAELGSRHLEILELVLSGCTNLEISRSMKLSLGTVKNYVSALLLALDVKSRSHLVSLFH